MSHKARTVVILMGGPGAGKGTQARALTAAFGLSHISTGQMLRSEMASGSEFGRRVQSVLDGGGLLDDATVNRLVENRVQLSDCEHGFILDGYPRDLAQALAFQSRLNSGDRLIAVDIATELEKLVDRLCHRLTCESCGAIYNTISSPPLASGTCDRCLLPLSQRSDDREEVIRSRFEAYRRETLPLRQLYRELGVYHPVDGMRPPSLVSAEIAAILDSRVAANVV